MSRVEPMSVEEAQAMSSNAGVYARIYRVVSCIPAGRVATYGQLAELAEVPGGARQVGYALAALEDDHVPWHRVINARGEISLRTRSGSAAEQRRLLEAEGVCFDARGRVALKQFRWDPEPPDEP